MRKEFIACAAIGLASQAAIAQGTMGWPDTIRLMAREKSQATACVALLKSAGDKAAILEGQIAYQDAKAAADGVVAGLSIALVQGGKPQDFPTIQSDMQNAGTGLQTVCDSAVKSARAAQGTKGIVSGIVTEAVQPLIDALKAAASALWANHLETTKLEREMIGKQLEGAKWPEFVP